MSRPLVIYHANCTDGWCAAWIMHRCLGNDPELLPANYGDTPPVVDKRDVYVVDFSYPRKVMQQMYQDANFLIVLDHHKTAASECADLPFCVFDMKQSGAGLAYWWCHDEGHLALLKDQPKMLPIATGMSPLSQYVQDRDLFLFALDSSEYVNAAIRSYKYDLETWDYLAKRMATSPLVFAPEGEAIQRYRQQIISQALKGVHEIEIDGRKVKAVLCSVADIVSDVCGKLAEYGSFAATYCPTSDGMLLVSLRSPKSRGEDVGVIAKKYSGVGHRHAAGFKVKYNALAGVDVSQGAFVTGKIATEKQVEFYRGQKFKEAEN